MLEKFNNVQHYKINPSRIFFIVQHILYFVAVGLILFSLLDVYFKVLLVLLIGLEYRRQQLLLKYKNQLSVIEIRDHNLFLKRSNDTELQPITHFIFKQNRLFVELELHLKDEVRSELLCRDNFSSKDQFSLLMKSLRFIHC